MGSEEQIGSQYDKVSNAHYAVEGFSKLIQMNIIKEQSKRIEQIDVSKKRQGSLGNIMQHVYSFM